MACALASLGRVMKHKISQTRTALGLLGAAALFWATAFADELVYQGTFEWVSEDVIGVSGLEIDADGTAFAAVGDRGWLVQGRLTRENGALSGVEIDSILPLLSEKGLPVAARRTGDQSDAEGLAMAPDGSFWVSFERWAHVWRYANATASAEWIEDHPDFARMWDNRQLEALALHPDGTLYTFPENPLDGRFPVYVLRDKTWQVGGEITPSDGFAIVGADFDADGTLYVLERKLVLGLWWQNQLRRFAPGELGLGEVLWAGARGEYGNLEGISLWNAPDGLRVLLVSDNNGKRNKPTQFVEFLVTD